MEIKFKVWFEQEKHVIAGSGRVKLLEAIHQHGSISKAAASINLSYKKASKLIESMNATAGLPLVETSTGGAGGGGTLLTKRALTIIQQYKKAHQTLTNTCHELETLFSE